MEVVQAVDPYQTEGGREVELGLDLVRQVCRRAEEADLPCQEWPTGFSWTPLGVAQRVWAEPRLGDEGGSPAWRVQVRSALAGGFTGSPGELGALSRAMSSCALAAVVRDNDDRARLELASTLHVHAGNAVWAADLVGYVAWLQACEVKIVARDAARTGLRLAPELAEAPAEAAIAWPAPDAAESPAPARGFDPDPWPAEELRSCIARLALEPGVRAVLTPQGLVASFALAEQPLIDGLALMQIETRARRAGLGRGLSVVLVAPGQGGVREALALNEREMLPGWDTDLLGGWSIGGGGLLQHCAFYPDALYREGLLTQLVESTIRRVDSVVRPRGLGPILG